MSKRVANAPRPPARKAPVIDVRRHHDALCVAASHVRGLVKRLLAGKHWLFSHTANDPGRPRAERLWADLVTQTYSALREAYARFALLRIGIGDAAAIDLWNREMPQASEMEDVGIPQMIAHWSTRSQPPEWITADEGRLLVQSIWPPRGTDPIHQGLSDLVDEPPF